MIGPFFAGLGAAGMFLVVSAGVLAFLLPSHEVKIS